MSMRSLVQYKMSLKGRLEQAFWGLTISMKAEMSQEQIRASIGSKPKVEFEAEGTKEIYEWVRTTLVEQEYQRRGRGANGLLRREK